jgi:cell division protein FtsI/penicillin-binding protein 2
VRSCFIFLFVLVFIFFVLLCARLWQAGWGIF